MNFRKNFENDQLSLIQAKRGDFDNLYSIASDEEIWEQHPENDRWKKNKFSIATRLPIMMMFRPHEKSS